MSAPEVRMTSTSFAADESGPEWTSYDAECSECDQSFAHWREPDVHEWAQHHEETCAPLRLARLQARWDARDETERALIEKWRADAFEDARDAQATAIERCADELERAIGGGDA